MLLFILSDFATTILFNVRHVSKLIFVLFL